MSTKSGAMTVLLLYMISYIAGLVYCAIQVNKDKFKIWLTEETAKESMNCLAGLHKDVWWCKEGMKMVEDINKVLIALIVYLALLIVAAIVAVFGTSKGYPWLILPWICLKIGLMAMLGALAVMVVVLMGIYKSNTTKTGDIIASGVCVAVVGAFTTYVWLCVVSYFQALREVSKLGLNKDMEHVVPFENEDHYNDGYDSEDEYGMKNDLDDDGAEKTDSLEYKPEDNRPISGVSRPRTAASRPRTAASIKSAADHDVAVDDFEPDGPTE